MSRPRYLPFFFILERAATTSISKRSASRSRYKRTSEILAQVLALLGGSAAFLLAQPLEYLHELGRLDGHAIAKFFGVWHCPNRAPRRTPSGLS